MPAEARRTTGDSVAVAGVAADRAQALGLVTVSRETAERLDEFVALLLEWQRKVNLVASSTLSHVWTRHIADSLQLLDLASSARTWIDVGSGAGFPGMVVACALTHLPGAHVDLVESNRKKATFLEAVQRNTGCPAAVHPERVEDFAARFSGHADVVCARAVAPLNELLTLTYPLLNKTGAVALFPKGQNADRELRETANQWRMHAIMVPSRTDPAGRIIVIRGLSRRPNKS
jgi:16S rRNA (guanine527-N7)-methyltransferase